MKSEIEEFFDRLAPEWDTRNTTTQEELESLLDKIPVEKGMNVLDVACGTGILTGLLQQRTENKVIGIDISENMIQIAKKKYKHNSNVEFIKSDFLSYQTENIDMIMIHNAYPHFLDPIKIKEEALRILNPNGYLIILHSLSRENLNRHHSNVMHVSRTLEEPEIEQKIYFPQFKSVKAEEDDSHYLIILQRI